MSDEFDVARKYFRAVYITEELPFLSRVLLIVGLPAQLLAATLAVYDLATIEAFPAAAIVGATLVAMVACFALLTTWRRSSSDCRGSHSETRPSCRLWSRRKITRCSRTRSENRCKGPPLPLTTRISHRSVRSTLT